MTFTLAIKTEEFHRQQLSEILAQCTSPQQDLFHRVYPNGVTTNQLVSAYDLCERTIKKNLKGR